MFLKIFTSLYFQTTKKSNSLHELEDLNEQKLLHNSHRTLLITLHQLQINGMLFIPSKIIRRPYTIIRRIQDALLYDFYIKTNSYLTFKKVVRFRRTLSVHQHIYISITLFAKMRNLCNLVINLFAIQKQLNSSLIPKRYRVLCIKLFLKFGLLFSHQQFQSQTKQQLLIIYAKLQQYGCGKCPT